MAQAPLQNPLPLDDAICYEANGGVLIEPSARPLRWLPFAFLAVLCFLTFLLGLATLKAILGNLGIISLLGGLVQLAALSIVMLGLLFALYAQWRSLQMPVIFINPNTQLIECVRANAIRRIPFAVVSRVSTTPNLAVNPLERLQNELLARLPYKRQQLVLVLKHGENLRCGITSGVEAESRAEALRQRLQYYILNR